MTTIFICHRANDVPDVAGRLCDLLRKEFGDPYVVYPLGLGSTLSTPHDEFIGRLEDTDALVLLIGRHWNPSALGDQADGVRLCLEVAIGLSIPVIPVFVNNSAAPDERQLPASLRELAFRNGIQLRRDPDFRRDLGKIVKAIRSPSQTYNSSATFPERLLQRLAESRNHLIAASLVAPLLASAWIILVSRPMTSFIAVDTVGAYILPSALAALLEWRQSIWRALAVLIIGIAMPIITIISVFILLVPYLVIVFPIYGFDPKDEVAVGQLLVTAYCGFSGAILGGSWAAAISARAWRNCDSGTRYRRLLVAAVVAAITAGTISYFAITTYLGTLSVLDRRHRHSFGMDGYSCKMIMLCSSWGIIGLLWAWFVAKTRRLRDMRK